MRRVLLPLVMIALSALCDGAYAKPFGVGIANSWPAHGGAQRTARDLLEVTDLGSVAAAKTGHYVAFVSRSADEACNCYHQTLRIIEPLSGRGVENIDIGQPFRAMQSNGQINGALMNAQPQWSPTLDAMAFVANENGRAVLKVWIAKGRKIRCVTSDAVDAFLWNSLGTRIIYETSQPNQPVTAEIERDARTGFLYGPQFLDVPSGEMPEAPTVPELFTTEDEKTASDGRSATVAFRSSDPITSTVREADAGERLTFDHETASSPYQPVLRRPDSEINGARGRFSLEIVHRSARFTAAAFVIDHVGHRKVRARVDRRCPGDIADSYWDDAASRFVLVCPERGNTWRTGYGAFIFLDPVSGSSHYWFKTLAPGIFDGDMGRSCDIANGSMICVDEKPSSPPSLISVDPSGRTRTLYDPNVRLRAAYFESVDELRSCNHQGMSTWAYLVHPAKYEGNEAHPLVVVQYNASGFLRGGTGNENPIFLYADSGFFVLASQQPPPAIEDPNLSGLALFAAQRRHNKWLESIQESLDIVIEHLIAKGLVDANRIAYTGLSAGANQIDYALASGRRLAVAISSTCCTDPDSWPSDAASFAYGDILNVVDWGSPADYGNRAKWAAVSPGLHVPDIHTAFLANSSQAEMTSATAFWFKMHSYHRPMELYVYPGEHHIKTAPVHRMAIYQRNVDWLQFWLQGYENPLPSSKAQYEHWRDMRDEWRRHDSEALALRGPRVVTR